MEISFVVAVARNGVIGLEGDLPWHVPADLKFFKGYTLGKPVIMGRKTWETMVQPLPKRTNIVVTRKSGYRAEGAFVAATIEEALELARKDALAQGREEVCVIGGAEIYRLAFPYATKLVITEIDLAPEGDTVFPEFEHAQWRETWREDHAAEGDTPAYSFTILERA